MTRLVGFFLRNWPLKLGAVALATILYGGLVLSESTLTWGGQVRIEVTDPPQNAAVGAIPVDVSGIRYRAPIDVARRLTNGSFRAYVDLGGIEPQPGGASERLPVQVEAVDPAVEIVDFQPRFVEVLIDPLVTREMRVSVDEGIIPDRLDVGPSQVDPPVVTLSGGSSRVNSVRAAVARVGIDGSAINIDEQVEVELLDSSDNIVPGVQAEPERVRVRISVAPSIETATLPVSPLIVGDIAPGHVLGPIAVEPRAVTVSGAETDVATLGVVPTEPIDISGQTGVVEVDAVLDLPPQVTVSGAETVSVTLEIVPADGAQIFQAGLRLDSTEPDLAYSVSPSSVLVTLSGSLPVLGALEAGAPLAIASVAGLPPGEHEVAVDVEAPPGTALQAVEPGSVVVVISEAPALVVSPAPTVALPPSPPPSVPPVTP
ncbi:hypothetical protein BH24CHL8_BH24CHL8_07600 [soil metagenome]